MDLQAPTWSRIASAPELLLELRLYESCPKSWRGTRQGAEPPAGPPKLDLELAESTFSKIPTIFGVMEKHILQEGSF